jgi:hypothetical protein
MCTDIFVLASLVHVRLYENYFNLSCNCVFVRTVKFWPKSKRGLKTAFSSANGGRGCRKFEGFGGNLGGFVPPPPPPPPPSPHRKKWICDSLYSFRFKFQIQIHIPIWFWLWIWKWIAVERIAVNFRHWFLAKNFAVVESGVNVHYSHYIVLQANILISQDYIVLQANK